MAQHGVGTGAQVDPDDRVADVGGGVGVVLPDGQGEAAAGVQFEVGVPLRTQPGQRDRYLAAAYGVDEVAREVGEDHHALVGVEVATAVLVHRGADEVVRGGDLGALAVAVLAPDAPPRPPSVDRDSNQ